MQYWDQCIAQSKKKSFLTTIRNHSSLKRNTRQGGVAGVNMFDVHSDMLGWVLTDSLRAGLKQCGSPIIGFVREIIIYIYAVHKGRIFVYICFYTLYLIPSNIRYYSLFSV